MITDDGVFDDITPKQRLCVALIAMLAIAIFATAIVAMIDSRMRAITFAIVEINTGDAPYIMLENHEGKRTIAKGEDLKLYHDLAIGDVVVLGERDNWPCASKIKAIKRGGKQ